MGVRGNAVASTHGVGNRRATMSLNSAPLARLNSVHRSLGFDQRQPRIAIERLIASSFVKRLQP